MRSRSGRRRPSAGLYRPRAARGSRALCQTAGMDFVRLDSEPALRHPRMVAAFRGWNDAGGAASLAAGYLRAVTDAERFAVIDSEPFIDYQQTRPTVQLVDGDVRQARVAGDRGVRIAVARPSDRARHRAEHALAGVLGRDRRARAQVRVGARDHDGGAARRHAAHAAGAGLGERVRSRADDPPRPRELDLRGPDRASSACCTTRARGPASSRPACGRPRRTTSRPPRTRRPRWRSSSGWPRSRARLRAAPSCSGRRASTSCGWRRRSPTIPTWPATSSSSSRPPTATTRRPARSWPPTSSATCASRPTTRS